MGKLCSKSFFYELTTFTNFDMEYFEGFEKVLVFWEVFMYHVFFCEGGVLNHGFIHTSIPMVYIIFVPPRAAIVIMQGSDLNHNIGNNSN